MSMEHLAKWELAGETEVLGGNLSQCHFSHHKSHNELTWDRTQARGVKAATNHLSYGTAYSRALQLDQTARWALVPSAREP
jgi:hypothetical protein